jgi:hypothetical protein
MAELREQRDGPTPPRNTTEVCHACADYGPDEIEYTGGTVYGLCRIPRERAARLYPMLRSVGVPPTAIMPCWRAR